MHPNLIDTSNNPDASTCTTQDPSLNSNPNTRMENITKEDASTNVEKNKAGML